MDLITIRGARQHNLKGIDVHLPQRKFTVITGVSGSGKSSLAFDTLFAEGQRRYFEALSTRARQFLQQLDVPQVDEITGLSPSIAIDQKRIAWSARSTVGTLTEIYDLLRLLFSRLGTFYCPGCGQPIHAYSIPQMVQEIMDTGPMSGRVLVMGPIGTVSEREFPKVVKGLRRDGFARIRVDGDILEVEPFPQVARRPAYMVEVIVDRLVLDRNKSHRLADSLELAVKMGNGVAVVQIIGEWEKTFTTSSRCTSCGFDVPEITPSLFSFHHPAGTCPSCKGLGHIDPDITGIPSFEERGDHDFPIETEQTIAHPSQERTAHPDIAENAICPYCQGTRLNETARAVKLNGLGIHEVSKFVVPRLRDWILSLQLSPTKKLVAERPIQEIVQRLDVMAELGLPYLTMDRAAGTVSGGEAQRIRLVQQIGNRLSGVLYVLDEPSIGLHPRDHQHLLDILLRLRDEGNTVVVVEHDSQSILQADYVVDIGPGAGTLGGELLYEGPPAGLLQHPSSLTGLYLSGGKSIPVPPRRKPFVSGAISIKNARGNNLKDLSVDFPLQCLTAVTGVSGSGKSTLVLDTLYRALSKRLHGSKAIPAPFDSMTGTENIRKVILADQSPIGRNPRSTPATYTGVFTLIRELFSRLPESRSRGYGPGRFSFNARGGRCEVCKGEGLQKIEMFFLPDIYTTCPICNGTRYSADTLNIHFKGLSISDVLGLTVNEAVSLFENIPAIRNKLESLQEVGLGYVTLGQPATSLSGGEAQRVKLSTELARRATERALYIMDEPTTGLHFEDIQRLLHILQRLVDAGHTVVLIEHNLDVIKTADYVIDLGPEGGERGGQIVASGSPEQVAAVKESYTGQYLKASLLNQEPKER